MYFMHHNTFGSQGHITRSGNLHTVWFIDALTYIPAPVKLLLSKVKGLDCYLRPPQRLCNHWRFSVCL